LFEFRADNLAAATIAQFSSLIGEQLFFNAGIGNLVQQAVFAISYEFGTAPTGSHDQFA
jgi:hypothetical protein